MATGRTPNACRNLGRVEEQSAVATAQDLLRWSEALSAIARTGLGFTESLYERERFEEVLKVAADIRVAAGHELEAEVLVEEWLKVGLQHFVVRLAHPFETKDLERLLKIRDS